MIDLTIKTLDSQNRAFTVPEDYTVRQLKEHIAEAVSIAPDVQRLIYCGRVLVDEHKLSQYNVHGKVIHLVERAPPSTSRGDPDGGSTTGDQGPTGGGGGFGNLPRFHFVSGGGGPRGRRGRGQDNTMYLGAMAFPADLMDARGISMPQPRPCLTRSRLLVARSMLNTASRTLARLENPRSASSERATATGAEPSSSQESVVESPTPTPDVTSRRNSTSDTQSEDNDESNLELATQAATAAALVSAVLDEAVAQNTSNQQSEETIDITIEEVESSGPNTGAGGLPEDLSMMEDAESPISPIVLSPSCPETPRDAESPPSMETEPEPTLPGTSATPPQQPATNSSSTQPAADTASSQHQRGQPARPQSMATIIGQLNELNQRLEPFMNQYYNLLQADPNYETTGEPNQQGTTSGESASTSDVPPPPPTTTTTSTTTATNSEGQTAPPPATSTAEAPPGDYPRTAAEADLLFRSISEIMHALSHSYHALSDIVCSFSRQPGQGRVLRCRPVLIQHSAVLHAPVPVIVERAAQSISLDRNRQQAAQQQQQQQSATSSTGVGASSNTTDQQPTAAAAAAASVNNGGAGARFQISPNNLDIFMEMGPTITIDSVEATILQRPNASTPRPTATGTTGTRPASTGPARSNASGTTPAPGQATGTPSAGTGNVPTGQFPWGTPPPPEFIQNLPSVTPPDFIQNLVQSISERIGDVGEANIHIAFPGAGGTLIASTVPPAVPPAPAQAPPQTGQQAGPAATTGTTSPTGGARVAESTQARVNTQTHPTTSTQTRSTSRPQIHLARTIQNHLRTFDPFLPCNSHHIRNRRNGSTRSGSNNTNTSQSAWQSMNNNNNNGATASTGPTNVRSTPSGVTAEFNMPATAPFRNIVESILSHSLENMSQGGVGGLGPNIVALGPGATFGPGGTANISFEIGRVTPLTVNTAGLASMMGAAAGAASGAAAAAAGNVNSAAPPRPDGSNMDSPQSPPLAHQGLPPGGANAGGGFLASLFGQLGNLLPHAGNSDLLGGMRNAGGTTNNNPGNQQGSGEGAGGANNRPWVEIASSGGGAIGSPDFISFLQNMAAQNTNMPFYQPQQQAQGQSQPQSTPAPSAPPAPSVSPLLPLVRRLLLDQQDSVTNHMSSSLAQFLGLTLRTPLSGSSEFLPDLLFTVLSTVTLGDILSAPSTSNNSPVDHSLFTQFVERRFGPGGIGSRYQPSHYLNIMEAETERYFNSMPNVLSRLFDDIDLARSLSRLNVDLMEPIIRLMGNTTGPLFRSRFLDSLKAYFQNLVSLLIRCFNDSTFVTTLLRTIVQREIAECQASAMTGESLPSPSSSPSFSSSHPQRVSLLIQMIPNLVQLVSSQYRPVSWYLVYHNPSHSGLGGVLRPPRAGTTPQVSSNPGPRGGEPMDIEAAAEAPAPVNSRPDDPLPDNIIIGSESWHNTIPSDWVPIITRDSQRQRREPNQGPFSDAYLAGMPTKRRKIVTSEKPANNLSKVISDTMKSALGAAGVSTSSDAIATAAAADPQLRVAYREQVRAQVRESLQSCPDYTSERYPNSTKFFDAKKKQ
uniref:Large proline-rich protein BAG6 n=1 Tax=Cacopsylla melanoneura TaxID=428564 RepID=A0A8D8WC05_9HEMI